MKIKKLIELVIVEKERGLTIVNDIKFMQSDVNLDVNYYNGGANVSGAYRNAKRAVYTHCAHYFLCCFRNCMLCSKYEKCV